jgi:hypothetical protein
MLDRLSVKDQGNYYDISIDKNTFARVYKESLSKLLTEIIIRDDILKKELESNFTNVSTNFNKAHNSAEKYANMYIAYMRKFFKNTNIKPITKNSKEYKYFIELDSILEDLQTNFDFYLKIQHDRLKFIGGKKFPTPVQLVSNNAIVAFHEHKAQIDEDVIPLTDDDKNTPLKENPRYVKLLKKYKSDEASIAELEYLKKCQIARAGKASQELIDTIKRKKIVG